MKTRFADTTAAYGDGLSVPVAVAAFEAAL